MHQRQLYTSVGQATEDTTADMKGLHNWFALQRLDQVADIVCDALGISGLRNLQAFAVDFSSMDNSGDQENLNERLGEKTLQLLRPQEKFRFIRALEQLGSKLKCDRRQSGEYLTTGSTDATRTTNTMAVSDINSCADTDTDKADDLAQQMSSSEIRSSRGYIPSHERKRIRRLRLKSKQHFTNRTDTINTTDTMSGGTAAQPPPPPWMHELSRMLSDSSREVVRVFEQQSQSESRQYNNTTPNVTSRASNTTTMSATPVRLNPTALPASTIRMRKILAHVSLMHTKGFMTVNDKHKVKQELITRGCQAAVDLLASLPGARFQDPVPHIKKRIKKQNEKHNKNGMDLTYPTKQHANRSVHGVIDARSIAATVSSLSPANITASLHENTPANSSWDSHASSSAIYAAMAASLFDARANDVTNNYDYTSSTDCTVKPCSKAEAAEAETLARLALGVGQHGVSVSHVLRSTYQVKANTPDMIRFQRGLRDGSPVCALSSFEPVQARAKQLVSSFGEGTRRLLYEPNAGGASEKSEAISFEVLQALFTASELLTELEIRYNETSSIVDFACVLEGMRTGVSVTRAMKYKPGPHAFTRTDARRLLRKKLQGLARASDSVCDAHAWDRRLLHVWAQSYHVALLISLTFDQFVIQHPELCEGVQVLITVCHVVNHMVFFNEDEAVDTSFLKSRVSNISLDRRRKNTREWKELGL